MARIRICCATFLLAASLSGCDDEGGDAAPVIDRGWPLARAADAHRGRKASELFGKGVLRVAEA